MAVLNSQTEPGKKSRRFYIILGATILLTVLIASIVAFQLSNINQTNYGPGPIVIEVTADKPSYSKSEEINFTIYVNNPQDWPVLEPLRVTYRMEKDGGEIFEADVDILVGDYTPSFPPHSRTLYTTRVWDQKLGSDSNFTNAEAGNYSFKVLFLPAEYSNGGNCTFEIR